MDDRKAKVPQSWSCDGADRSGYYRHYILSQIKLSRFHGPHGEHNAKMIEVRITRLTQPEVKDLFVIAD